MQTETISTNRTTQTTSTAPVTPVRHATSTASTCVVRICSFLRTHAVLVVAFVAALVTVVLVPPDAAYLDYFDWKTLACLLCFLVLIEALRARGFFDVAARALLARVTRQRAVITTLVGTTLAISLFATNDMALLIMLPLSATTLLHAGWRNRLVFTFTMQSLAANLGGMILPFGNPQNLFLYEFFQLDLTTFLSIMAVPFVISVALVFLCCLVFSEHGTQGTVCAPEPMVQKEKKHIDASLLVYAGLIVLTLAAVFRLVAAPIALTLVVAALLVFDRSALTKTDLPLFLTFLCFFMFAGNVARMPAVAAILSAGLDHATLLVSAALSQIISNVPSAVLLAHLASPDMAAALLAGVNIGGAGTLVASLASLITLNQFCKVAQQDRRKGEATVLSRRRFVVEFSAFNFAFLAVLLVVCLPLF